MPRALLRLGLASSLSNEAQKIFLRTLIGQAIVINGARALLKT